MPGVMGDDGRKNLHQKKPFLNSTNGKEVLIFDPTLGLGLFEIGEVRLCT